MKQYQGKAKVTSVAIKPAVRKMADELCLKEGRSLANLLEVALLEYAAARGYDIDNYYVELMEPQKEAA